MQDDAAAGVVRENGRDVYVDVSEKVTAMQRQHELAPARRLLCRQLPLDPRNGGLWAQLANLERRLASQAGGSSPRSRLLSSAAK